MTRGDHYLSCRAAPAPARVDRERCRCQTLVVEPRRRSFEIGFWFLWSASCAVKSLNAASRHAACVRRSRAGQRRDADCATTGNGSSSAHAGRKTRAWSFPTPRAVDRRDTRPRTRQHPSEHERCRFAEVGGCPRPAVQTLQRIVSMKFVMKRRREEALGAEKLFPLVRYVQDFCSSRLFLKP